MENILPFWYPRGVDTTNGGYKMHYDAQGNPKPGTKMIVTQARMMWFYARMARAGHGDKQRMLAAADTGFRFLRDRMWDKEHSGFLWEVDATGRNIVRAGKHMYGQAFALYALSELALASQRRDVTELALKQFEAMEERAHDNLHGGYREWFSRDWKPATRRGNTIHGRGHRLTEVDEYASAPAGSDDHVSPIDQAALGTGASAGIDRHPVERCRAEGCCGVYG